VHPGVHHFGDGELPLGDVLADRPPFVAGGASALADGLPLGALVGEVVAGEHVLGVALGRLVEAGVRPQERRPGLPPLGVDRHQHLRLHPLEIAEAGGLTGEPVAFRHGEEEGIERGPLHPVEADPEVLELRLHEITVRLRIARAEVAQDLFGVSGVAGEALRPGVGEIAGAPQPLAHLRGRARAQLQRAAGRDLGRVLLGGARQLGREADRRRARPLAGGVDQPQEVAARVAAPARGRQQEEDQKDRRQADGTHGIFG
jgi:hypothetical protein